MKNRLVFGAGMGVGYVLGTRAGRGAYEQLRTRAQKVWNSPTVQDRVSSTTDTIKSKAPALQDSLKGKLKKGGSPSDDGAKASQNPGKDVGASGDLPLDVPPVVTAMDTGSAGLGPSGGDPLLAEDTPFQAQDGQTRPDLDR